MSGELAGCVFIYMCSLHWLEGAELGKAAEKEEKGNGDNSWVPVMRLAWSGDSS